MLELCVAAELESGFVDDEKCAIVDFEKKAGGKLVDRFGDGSERAEAGDVGDGLRGKIGSRVGRSRDGGSWILGAVKIGGGRFAGAGRLRHGKTPDSI